MSARVKERKREEAGGSELLLTDRWMLRGEEGRIRCDDQSSNLSSHILADCSSLIASDLCCVTQSSWCLLSVLVCVRFFMNGASQAVRVQKNFPSITEAHGVAQQNREEL